MSGSLFFPDKKKDDTCHNHEAAEQLPHGYACSNKAKMGVRLPEKLDKNPKDAIEYHADCHHGS